MGNQTQVNSPKQLNFQVGINGILTCSTSQPPSYMKTMPISKEEECDFNDDKITEHCKMEQ